ncbi:hypothetical protein WJX74_009283 [Apatococcus lobatus]|uniref:ArsA/GET3 Anion-transporting ATPase-like domain-containing protein n=1 Tax=Apatococcus lobatus TaxID=904363 RepID=A0AAW1QJE4_9CHLO
MAEETPPDPTLSHLLDHSTLKWIFVGGKGGVGKTTTSSSLAVQLAAKRRSVLIISTDPAHNLSDAFRQKFTRHPTPVEGVDNLFAMEIDPTPEQTDLAELDSGPNFLSDLTSSIPGIDEAMSFAEVMRQVQSFDYECIVFDTAPTGHTLRLLQFPATLQKGLSKLMSLRGAFGGMLGQLTSMLGLTEDGNTTEGLLNKLDSLKNVVDEIGRQFRDPELTTFVCVCIPEFLSLYETERLVQELAKFEMDCSSIVINQIIFPEMTGSSRLLEARVRMQQRYLAQFDDLYEDFHLVKLPLLEEEVRGTDALLSFSKSLMRKYSAAASADLAQSSEDDLRQELQRLRQRCLELERQLASHK